MGKTNQWRLGALTLLVLLAGCSTSHDLSDAEKSALMTEKDFAAYSEKPVKGLQGAFKKTTHYLGNSYQLEYQNDAKKAEFFVYSILAVEDSDAKAVTMVVSYKTGVAVGFKYSGIQEEPIKLSKPGQQDSLSLLKYEGKPAGNLFTTVIDKKVVLLMFTGIYFDNEDAFREFIDNYISRVTKFEADRA